MRNSSHQPRLRLVGTSSDAGAAVRTPMKPEPAPAILRAGMASAMRAVDAENRAAANPDIDPTDPRWVLAARAHSLLDGAALAPDRREKLMRLARQLGIRPFDASVIVALVQDRARRGRSLHDITDTLLMMPLQQRNEKNGVGSRFRYFGKWFAAIVCAFGAAALLIQWVLAG